MTSEVLNIILILGGFIAAISYFIFSIRKGESKASRESNDILRGLIDDQKNEILSLRERMHDMVNQMTSLKINLQILTDRRDYIENIVTTALQDHFERNPEAAMTARIAILGQKKKQKQREDLSKGGEEDVKQT